jgi:ABC-2 type transport system ATP-binding protein
LDPNQIRQMRSVIRQLAGAHTVLLSSHILSEVESVCDRVVIVDEGRIAGQGTPSELSGILRGNSRAILEVNGPSGAVASALEAVPGVVRVTVESSGDWVRATCECAKGSDARPGLYRAVVAGGWDMREMREERGTLEDVFVQVTGGMS